MSQQVSGTFPKPAAVTLHPCLCPALLSGARLHLGGHSGITHGFCCLLKWWCSHTVRGALRGHGHTGEPGGDPRDLICRGSTGVCILRGNRLAARQRARGKGAAEASERPQTRAGEGLRSRGKEDTTLGSSEVFTRRRKLHREVREGGSPPFLSPPSEMVLVPGEPTRAAAPEASLPASTARHNIPVPTWLPACHTHTLLYSDSPSGLVLMRWFPSGDTASFCGVLVSHSTVTAASTDVWTLTIRERSQLHQALGECGHWGQHPLVSPAASHRSCSRGKGGR